MHLWTSEARNNAWGPNFKKSSNNFYNTCQDYVYLQKNSQITGKLTAKVSRAIIIQDEENVLSNEDYALLLFKDHPLS
jgi:hypothetical protein